jgi:hypothetical protein
MDARVVALEGEIAGIKATLSSMEQGQAALIAMFEKSIGKRKEEGVVIVEETPVKGPGEGSKPKAEGSGVSEHNDAALLEFRQAVKKVELPMFDGTDPAGWISRAEIYFRIQGTRPEVKIYLAQLCMEGATIHFFNSLINEEGDVTWEQLKQALLDRYGGHGDGDIYEQLTELRQTGNVDDYITDFEYLTAQIPRLPDKQFQGYFLHGLKGEIRGKVGSLAVMGDLGRSKLLQVTRAIEKEVEGRNGPGRHKNPQTGYGSNRSSGLGPNRGTGSDWVLVKGGRENGPVGGGRSNEKGVQGDRQAHGDRRGGVPRDRGYTQLSYNELMDRKQKNLCFKCKGPYSRTHQCPDKHLKVLVTDDDEGSEDEGKILAVEVSEEEEGVDGEMNVLSLFQLGQSKPQSIQLKGILQEVPIVILVDSGATHNFIDKRLVQKMGWPADNSKSMWIRLGDGSRVQSGGVCSNLSIDIEGVQVDIEAQLFDLGGMDLILGVDWLRTLGDIIMNWNSQSMSFWYNKK